MLSLQHNENQSEASIFQQRHTVACAIDRLDRYEAAGQYQVRSLIFVGGPGVGKTTLLQFIILCVFARGLYGALTANMSERAL